MGSISEKVLIQQLRDLVAINVLNRHDYKCVPPMVDYSLTPFGETLGNQSAQLFLFFVRFGETKPFLFGACADFQ